jgi:hypothetical protein
VLAPECDEVLGCVYLYPAADDEHDAKLRSWVRADVPELDVQLHDALLAWLAADWPFENVDAAPRG